VIGRVRERNRGSAARCDTRMVLRELTESEREKEKAREKLFLLHIRTDL